MHSNLSRPADWRTQVLNLVYKAIEVAGGNRHALARELGVCYQTILSWTRGAVPGNENLLKLENFVRK